MTGNGHENETTRLRQLIMGFRTTQLVYVRPNLGSLITWRAARSFRATWLK